MICNVIFLCNRLHASVSVSLFSFIYFFTIENPAVSLEPYQTGGNQSICGRLEDCMCFYVFPSNREVFPPPRETVLLCDCIVQTQRDPDLDTKWFSWWSEASGCLSREVSSWDINDDVERKGQMNPLCSLFLTGYQVLLCSCLGRPVNIQLSTKETGLGVRK